MALFNHGHDVRDFAVEQQSPYINTESHSNTSSALSDRNAQTTNNIPLRNTFSSQVQTYPMIYPSIATSMSSPVLHTPNGGHTIMLQNSYSSEIVDPNGIMTIASNSHWESSIKVSDPSIWISGDFDITALNNSVSGPTGMGMGDPLFQPEASPDAIQGTPQISETVDHAIEGVHPDRTITTKTVRKAWFTYVDEDEREEIRRSSLTKMPIFTRDTVNSVVDDSVHEDDRYSLGDSFRAAVCQKLKAHTNNGTLPSTNYLVSRCEIRNSLKVQLMRMFRIYLFKYTLPSLMRSSQ
jgi:hypothetical protein